MCVFLILGATVPLLDNQAMQSQIHTYTGVLNEDSQCVIYLTHKTHTIIIAQWHQWQETDSYNHFQKAFTAWSSVSSSAWQDCIRSQANTERETGTSSSGWHHTAQHGRCPRVLLHYTTLRAQLAGTWLWGSGSWHHTNMRLIQSISRLGAYMHMQGLTH